MPERIIQSLLLLIIHFNFEVQWNLKNSNRIRDKDIPLSYRI